MMSADDVAARCQNPRKNADGWEACCPAHDDTSPSLSITPGQDKVLLHCFAGCTYDEIVTGLGLQPADLSLHHPTTNGRKQIVKTYEYFDAEGSLAHETVRYDPKDFRQRRPDPANPGVYLWRLKGIELVLYHLPDVLAAVQRGETVYLCEGEKDADALQALGLMATCNAMGAKKWRKSYTETLRGAEVVILPDNDTPGRQHAELVAQSLDGTAHSVKVLALPNLPDKGDVSNWLQAGGTVAQLQAMGDATPLWTSTTAQTPAAIPTGALQGPRPVIRITTTMTDVVDRGQAALLALPDAPVMFQRARSLCVIARGVTPPTWLHRPPDAPVILEASPARLRELASHAARWEKHDARKDVWVSALPPAWFVETLQGRPAWPFPVLEGIIGAPTLRPDGSVLDTPGYDVSTGLWLDSNGTYYPTLADHPTRDDARNAVNAVHDVLQNFPFVGSGFAAALAAVLSIVCRFTIRGCVPLFAVRSTTRGSGKGLLVDVLSIIGTGRPAPRWPQSDNDEEDRKRLLTVAMAGDATIHIDNVVKALGSPALDLALTAPSVTDRVLGKTAKVEAPLTMVWFASGNNMQFKGDTARRVVPMDLDAQMERPEERTGFAYPRLLDHVRHTRPALVSAALTIVHAYFQAGTPAQGLSPYGSFQEWSDLIRAAVVWAGDADPCEGRKNLEAESDPAFDRLATLLECWEACYSNKEATVVQVLQDVSLQATPIDMNNPANKWHELHEALSAFDPTYRGQQLSKQLIGTAMGRIEGRIVDGKRFVKGETRQKTGWPWRVAGVAGVAGVANPGTPRKSVRSVRVDTSQNHREKIESESLTLSGKRGGFATPATPATPETAPHTATQQFCSRCGEMTTHTWQEEKGTLSCICCSTLPDDKAFPLVQEREEFDL
jgi:putative DNA primase/helicase